MYLKQYDVTSNDLSCSNLFFFSFGCRFEPSLKFFIVGVGSTPWLVEWKQLDNLYKHSETEEMRKKKLRVKINQNRDFFLFLQKVKILLADFIIWLGKQRDS